MATTFNSVADFMSKSASVFTSLSVLPTVLAFAFDSVAASDQTGDEPVTSFMSRQLSWPSPLIGWQPACPKMPLPSHRAECRRVFWPSPLGFGASFQKVPLFVHHPMSRKMFLTSISASVSANASSTALAFTSQCVSLRAPAFILCYRSCQRRTTATLLACT